jgi:hypothetical protein
VVGLLAGAWLAALAAGCGGGDTHTPSILRVDTEWNDSPSAVDQIGYQLWVDVMWPDRSTQCYALPPNLQIHVGDQVLTPSVSGDCSSEMLVLANGFTQGGPVEVTVQSGEQVLGDGVYDNLFPYAAAAITAPPSGEPVKAGDPITVVVPTPVLDTSLKAALFYWTDTTNGVPPYYTFASATIADDLVTFQTTAPAITGHALIDVEGRFGTADFVTATSCSGFRTCVGVPTWNHAGPVAIEIVP